MNDNGYPELRWLELTFLERCGHAAMLAQPQALSAAVVRWLLETRMRRDRLAPVAGAIR